MHAFLTSAVVGGEWSASRPGRFTSGERAPGAHLKGARWAPEPVWMMWRGEKFVLIVCIDVDQKVRHQ
jgi:hypothetical protein